MGPNNLPSNPPFAINQKVVAVDAISGSRIKNGRVYEVYSCDYAQSTNPIANGKFFWYVGVIGHHNRLRPGIFAPYNPPRHQNVEIAEDILQMEVVEERCDVLPETVNN